MENIYSYRDLRQNVLKYFKNLAASLENNIKVVFLRPLRNIPIRVYTTAKSNQKRIDVMFVNTSKQYIFIFFNILTIIVSFYLANTL